MKKVTLAWIMNFIMGPCHETTQVLGGVRADGVGGDGVVLPVRVTAVMMVGSTIFSRAAFNLSGHTWRFVTFSTVPLPAAFENL